jgi:hypothetical protein
MRAYLASPFCFDYLEERSNSVAQTGNRPMQLLTWWKKQFYVQKNWLNKDLMGLEINSIQGFLRRLAESMKNLRIEQRKPAKSLSGRNYSTSDLFNQQRIQTASLKITIFHIWDSQPSFFQMKLVNTLSSEIIKWIYLPMAIGMTILKGS